MKFTVMQNFTRKLVAVTAAIVIWALVNHSITTTKLFPRVSCRVVNMPADKTIRGLMPNGTLDRKINLTLTGRKAVIDKLESSDFEVVIDAAVKKGDEWIIQIGKKNLVSLNPDIDLIHNVTHVSHNELALRLSRLVTEKIPVYFTIPQGEPPEGYQLLDITPQIVTHTLSGPEEDINELMAKGFELTFSLSSITKEELDVLHAHADNKDEISFQVPEEWKKVQIPFLGGLKVDINDPLAKHLEITFLRNQLLSLDQPLPLRVFYPVSNLDNVNPVTCTLKTPSAVELKDGMLLIKKNLYVSDVSRLFLDVVRDRIEIVVVLDDLTGKPLSWELQLVDPDELEDKYVALLLAEENTISASHQGSGGLFKPFHPRHSMRLAEKERYLRLRFREYRKNITLFLNKDDRFKLDCRYQNGSVVIGEI